MILLILNILNFKTLLMKTIKLLLLSLIVLSCSNDDDDDDDEPNYLAAIFLTIA
tara:strand:+ start:636 stop:797 length:162 start_codon:yes stop_codon:yes gene_type:complete